MFSKLPYLALIIKTSIICVFAIATRGTLPRYRFDQLTQLNWKHFIFVWLFFFFLSVSIHLLF